jgi:hypothetical protein
VIFLVMKHEINSSDLIYRVHDLISALKPLKNKPNCQLNVANFGACYKLSNEQSTALVDLVLHFQTLFHDEFKGYHLQSEWRKGNTYLRLVPSIKKDISNPKLRDVYISSTEAKILIDLTYIYQHVKIGRGFDPKLVQSEVCQNAKKLYSTHPYLMEKNGNGLLYPTSLAIKIGAELRIYTKLNRTLTTLTIDNNLINIGDEE